ncbi:MAG TPA: sigma-54 dependent transcriptional regulator [Candidatus Acidoferrum sp.]|nr:sigma-54 dependent transcriptional regulator [Candidatus Acidoferrum sp.]
MAAMATPAVARGRGRILVASGNERFRKELLRNPVYADALSEEAVGGAHALARLNEFVCDSVLLDQHLPDLDATEVADLIRQRYPHVEVELVDSRSTGRADGVSAGSPESEAEDEPCGTTESASQAARAAEETGASCEPLPNMIGESAAIREVYRLVRLVAGRETTVLVTGETGTGKELVARAIHQLSRRARGPFVVVNCAAIPEALLEAELFGHARGAYTGAVQSRLGRIHVAQGGTLFLDEIGELPLSMQAKLLRFLQNGEVQRLGSPDIHRVDVRVVCATNQRLEELARAKQFREDLYYRLAVFPIAVPPLRERRPDIALLARHFLEQLAAGGGFERKELPAEAELLLERCAWSGNVRELENAIERAFILSGNETVLRAEHFAVCGAPAN